MRDYLCRSSIGHHFSVVSHILIASPPISLQGSTAIAELVRQAQGRISIMAGGGVRAGSVERLIALTGVSAVHSSCSG